MRALMSFFLLDDVQRQTARPARGRAVRAAASDESVEAVVGESVNQQGAGLSRRECRERAGKTRRRGRESRCWNHARISRRRPEFPARGLAWA
jgi:hypothetical protein